MNRKAEIRLTSKKLRKDLNINIISASIILKIKDLDVYKTAKNVMLFYPKENEINLLNLLGDDKNFYLPRMTENNLECCPYNSGDDLKISKYNIKEPPTDSVDKNLMDIIFIPALAVDNNGFRIGYGGGYYDRFLQDIKAVKIVVIPDELKHDYIPKDKYDIPCDIIITQKKASILRG